MLAILLSLFFSAAIHAQGDYTYPTGNTEYKTTNQFVVEDGDEFSYLNDPTINLSMECLAANGYGQWTCASNPGTLGTISGHEWLINPDPLFDHGAGWYLLGNIIAKPSEKFVSGDLTHPGCQPPGIVAGGHFNLCSGVTFSSTSNKPKATANLGGSVRYVWIDDGSCSHAAANSQFIIQGLNDDRGTNSGPPTDEQIDISLNDLANPRINTQVIKADIFSYSNASSGTFLVDNTGNPLDRFDVACDGFYLYIVWLADNIGTGKKDVWVTAVELSSGNVPAGSAFPFSVASFAGSDCSSPTVACDVRGNGTVTPAPSFDVAFINSGSVTVNRYQGVTTLPAQTVTLNGILPNQKGFPDPFHSGVQLDYTDALHARVLVSSVYGSTALTHSIYVIAKHTTPATTAGLFLYNNLLFSAADVPVYVDGNLVNNATPHPLPSPIITFFPAASSSGLGVVDEPIIAFANPYDNQDLSTNGFHQFHCMYRVSVTTGATPPSINPLIIVQGANNGFLFPALTNDTRLLLNRNGLGIQSDPTSYIGAVNQMGIHMHWRIGVKHYYARNIRSFDEPIEENTLITNACTVSDGTAHGGTAGASTIGTRKITLWTDPNYGLTTIAGSGLYFTSNYYSGTLPGLYKLQNIGSLNYSSDPNIGITLHGLDYDLYDPLGGQSILYTVPNCNISFGATGQGINIGTSCTWQFFGTFRTNCFTNPGNGGVGLSGQEWGPGDFHFAFLNIHPGAQFFGVPVNANIGDVEIQWDHNIFPLKLSGSPNADSSGLLLLDHNSNYFTDSKVNSFLPKSAFINFIRGLDFNCNTVTAPITNMTNTVMAIFGPSIGNNSSVYTLLSTRTDYTNFAPPSDPTNPGASAIFYSGSCGESNGPDKVVFDHGSFNRMRFHAVDPKQAGLEITNNAVTGIHQLMIWIQNLCSVNQDYADIEISNNTFSNILTDGALCFPDADFCIQVEGFNKSNRFGSLNINSNTLDFSSLGVQILPIMDGALRIINSTGNIENNIIKNDVFTTGITITSTTARTFATTSSYLCSNTISGLANQGGSGVGILSDHYVGYVKIGTITGSNIGFVSGLRDHPAIFFSGISNSTNAGIKTTDNSTIFDVSGAHGATSSDDDYAAFNTIQGNGTSMTIPTQVLLTGGSIIEYGNNEDVWTSGHWTQYGENNTIGVNNAGATKMILIATITGTSALGNINRNWWGSGVDPVRGDAASTGNSPGLWDAGRTKEYSAGITYGLPANTRSSLNALATSSDSTASGTSVDCNGNFALTRHKGIQPLSIMDNTDTCKRWLGWIGIKPTSQEEYKMQYDTLRHYVESCGKNDDSYHAFNGLASAVQFMSMDTTRFDQFRNWLISVLYLNKTQPYYFCACMDDIEETYQEGIYSHIPNASLAVWDYLRKNHRECLGSDDSINYLKDTTYDRSIGIDPTKLPPLDSIGLGFLMHQNAVQSPSTPLSSQYLASFTSSPNPFIKETTLDFTLNRMSYVTLAIYDELGRLVWGDGRGSSLEVGMHSIQIDGSKLPSGTLYARIATGFGEAKTVKLVHEK